MLDGEERVKVEWRVGEFKGVSEFVLGWAVVEVGCAFKMVSALEVGRGTERDKRLEWDGRVLRGWRVSGESREGGENLSRNGWDAGKLAEKEERVDVCGLRTL